MSEKALKIVLAAVGGLVAVYVIAAMALRGGSPDAAGDARALVAALDAAGRGEPDSVRIVGPADTISLVRGPAGWTVNGYPADSSAVARLRDALSAARIGHLAAANPENHARLGVDDASAWRVELSRGGKATKLVVGNSGPAHPSAYVRLDGGADAFVLHGDFGSAARRGVSEWRDRTIVRVDSAAVQQIAVTRDGESFTLVRGDEGWAVDGAPADSLAVRDLLGELARLEAQDLAADGAEMGDIVRSLVALDAQGDTLAHVRMATTDESWTFRAAAAGKDALFNLASWRADRIAPERGRIARP